MHEGVLQLDTVIEDEILAALPMVPVHDTGTECAATTSQDNTETETEQMHRPFAALADLVGSDKNDG